jgi:hypothetical protein
MKDGVIYNNTRQQPPETDFRAVLPLGGDTLTVFVRATGLQISTAEY